MLHGSSKNGVYLKINFMTYCFELWLQQMLGRIKLRIRDFETCKHFWESGLAIAVMCFFSCKFLCAIFRFNDHSKHCQQLYVGKQSIINPTHFLRDYRSFWAVNVSISSYVIMLIEFSVFLLQTEPQPISLCNTWLPATSNI